MTGGTTARGYGAKHQAMRKRLAAQLESLGRVACVRCGLPIYSSGYETTTPEPGHVPTCRKAACEGQCWTAWDADHLVNPGGTGPASYRGHAHACCNRSRREADGVVNPGRREPLVIWDW